MFNQIKKFILPGVFILITLILVKLYVKEKNQSVDLKHKVTELKKQNGDLIKIQKQILAQVFEFNSQKDSIQQEIEGLQKVQETTLTSITTKTSLQSKKVDKVVKQFKKLEESYLTLKERAKNFHL